MIKSFSRIWDIWHSRISGNGKKSDSQITRGPGFVRSELIGEHPLPPPDDTIYFMKWHHKENKDEK